MKDEEREIENCLIMKIKKLKEQVKNLVQQVIGSCILAFTKKKKQDKQTTFNSKAYHEQMKRIDAEIKLEQAKKIIKTLMFSLENYFNLTNFEVLKERISEAKQFVKELDVNGGKDKLCEYCDQYKSCPDSERCRTCIDGSNWKRRKDS